MPGSGIGGNLGNAGSSSDVEDLNSNSVFCHEIVSARVRGAGLNKVPQHSVRVLLVEVRPTRTFASRVQGGLNQF